MKTLNETLFKTPSPRLCLPFFDIQLSTGCQKNLPKCTFYRRLSESWAAVRRCYKLKIIAFPVQICKDYRKVLFLVLYFLVMSNFSSWFINVCPVFFLPVSLSLLHCKDTIPRIRNKYFQKRNYVSVSDLYIPTIGLIILQQENMWSDPGNIYSKSLTDTWMWKLGLWPRNSFLGIHKWDFRRSVSCPHLSALTWSARADFLWRGSGEGGRAQTGLWPLWFSSRSASR